MSKIRKPSLLIPTAPDFVRSTLSSLGQSRGAGPRVYTSTPYWSHAVFDYVLRVTGLGGAFAISKGLGEPSLLLPLLSFARSVVDRECVGRRVDGGETMDEMMGSLDVFRRLMANAMLRLVSVLSFAFVVHSSDAQGHPEASFEEEGEGGQVSVVQLRSVDVDVDLDGSICDGLNGAS
jgi:hypothetical protein